VLANEGIHMRLTSMPKAFSGLVIRPVFRMFRMDAVRIC
jgi:hypothetical protein